jgi:hypothetical protein
LETALSARPVKTTRPASTKQNKNVRVAMQLIFLLRLAQYVDGARASDRFRVPIDAGLERFCASWLS